MEVKGSLYFVSLLVVLVNYFLAQINYQLIRIGQLAKLEVFLFSRSQLYFLIKYFFFIFI